LCVSVWDMIKAGRNYGTLPNKNYMFKSYPSPNGYQDNPSV